MIRMKTMFGLLLAAALLPGAGKARAQAEAVTTWTSYAHALSYQGRTLTRDSSGNYYAIIRRGSSVRVYRRSAATSAWSDLGSVNPTPLSGREGDCCAIAVDGFNRVHVVFYDGAGPNLVHSVSANGTVFSVAILIASSVTWNSAADGGPFLHVGRSNDLHVAYVDDAEERPYYARSTDGGITWSRSRVAASAPGFIRPSVISLSSGRLIYSFTAPNARVFYSDNNGTSWIDASPSGSGASSVANARLAGNGNRVYLTTQKLEPQPRAIIQNECDGATMAWAGWRTVYSGSGADASLYIDAQGRKNVTWRNYPNQPNIVYRSLDSAGSYFRSTVTNDTRDYILPFAYWQEYHRWNPADNAPVMLTPDRTNSTLYFARLPGSYLADADASAPVPPDTTGPPVPPVSPALPESVSTWSGFSHPLSYQGRTLTRDSSGNYFAVMRTGSQAHVWRRTPGTAAWTDLGALNATALSGREGDCCAIAVDGYNRLHAVYYDGSSPNLMHRSSIDGLVFGPAHSVQGAVTWNATADGGPFLHVGRSNDLHVAYVDDAGESPYYARSTDGGVTWSRSLVTAYAPGNIRPTVISLPSGRVIYSFSAPHVRVFISDNNGANWLESSPASTGAVSVPNARLTGDGNRIYLTGQRIDPTPRGIILNECDGTTMAWTGWRTVISGTGADASLFIDSEGRRNIVWRAYPEAPNSVWRSTDSATTFSRIKITLETYDYICPFAYWQEYHRWNPADNSPGILVPNLTRRTLFFRRMPGAYKADSGPLPKQSARRDEITLDAARHQPRMGMPAVRYRLEIFDLSGRRLGSFSDVDRGPPLTP